MDAEKRAFNDSENCRRKNFIFKFQTLRRKLKCHTSLRFHSRETLKCRTFSIKTERRKKFKFNDENYCDTWWIIRAKRITSFEHRIASQFTILWSQHNNSINIQFLTHTLLCFFCMNPKLNLNLIHEKTLKHTILNSSFYFLFSA